MMKPSRCMIALLSVCSILAAIPARAHAGAPDDAQRVSFTTIDRVKIAAIYQPAPDFNVPRPAILLMHGGNQSKMTWVEVGLFEALAQQGYHVLSIDIRGRGDSESGYEEELKRNPAIAQRDLVAAIEFLLEQPGVDPDNIALIGSSYGSNLIASWMMQKDDTLKIKTIVCLSATRVAYHFPPAFGDAEQHPIRCDALYVASDNEVARYEAEQTARKLATDTQGESRVQIYEGQGHAARILQHVDGSTELVLDWLHEHL